MNKVRRKTIEEIIASLESLKEDIQAVYDEEEEYRDNMPENLQSSEKYETADNAVEALDSAMSSLDEAIEYLNSAAE